MELQDLAVKIARSDNLPVLSQVASSVMRMADDPNASPKNLAKVIEQDPAISAKVLRVANSAYYGASNIASIGMALNMLGLNTVRALVVGIAYQQMISGKPQCKSFSKLAFWEHSLAVAVAARILAKMRMPSESEELYLAGLIHDVGMLVLERFAPEEYSRTIDLAHAEGISMQDAEQRVLGFGHDEVGGLLAEKWSMAPSMIAAVRYHHQPELDLVYGEKTRLIAFAEALAHHAGYSNNSPAHAEDTTALTELGMAGEQTEIIRNVIQAEVAKAQEAFQIREAA